MTNKPKTLTLKSSCIISLLAGAAIFLILYGTKILNPLYTDWIKTSQCMDLTQHYYGWLFFKNSDWNFPFGLFDSLSYPNKISIIFTDSIPIFAIFFKLILKLFKFQGEFQYFGIYALLCFSLQGLFGFLITRKFIKSNITSILYSILFCLSFPMISTMFVHTALSSHWILLSCFLILINYKIFQRKNIKFQALILALIAFFASSTHIYLIIECLIILFPYFILQYIYSAKKEKNTLKPALNSTILLSVFILTSLSVIYLNGGFSSGVWYETQNLINGFFRSDFLFLLRSGRLSVFHKILFNSPDAQVSAYCGLGFVFLLVLFFIKMLYNKFLLKKYRVEFLVFFILFLAVFFLSMFPILSFNNHVLYEFDLSSFALLEKLTNIFRANGRFVIINSYILMILPLFVVNKIKKKQLVFSLLALISFQFIDLYEFSKKHLSYYKTKHKYEKQIENNNFFKGKNNLLFLDINLFKGKTRIFDDMSLADFAFNNNFKMTYFYFARDMMNRGEYFKSRILNPQCGDIFVFMSFDEYNKYSSLLNCSETYKTEHHFFCRI